MAPPLSIPDLLASLLVLAVEGGLFVFILVEAILRRRAFRRNWRAGLLLAAGTLLLLAPNAALNIYHFDPAALPNAEHLPAFVRGPGFVVVVGLVAVGMLLLTAAWTLVTTVVAGAEWRRWRPRGLPLLTGAGAPDRRAMGAAALLGAGTGVVSAALFDCLGLEVSQQLRRLMQLFPTAGETTLWLRLPALLLAVLVPAVREEILFRGALQGFLHRVLGRGTGRTLLVYAGVSLCWAALHYHNTDAPLAKLGQIFVLGLLFCALARRWSVEVAVCAHMGLNAAALVAGLLLAGPAGA